jgi:hypothetical protein
LPLPSESGKAEGLFEIELNKKQRPMIASSGLERV